MADYREEAKAFKEKGIPAIPVRYDKTPTVNWFNYQEDPMTDEQIDAYFEDCFGIAIITKDIECLDFDIKFELTHDLMVRLKDRVPVEILEKLWVQKTMSGGFHWLYLTDVAEPNQKLASRYTTAYERHETYMQAFEDPDKRDKATNIAAGDKQRVLIETRGSVEENGKRIGKGYFLAAPTPGYEYIYGKLQKITNEERETLISICREFNEVIETKPNFKLNKYKKPGEDVFSWYNDEADVVKLLLGHGWEVVDERGKNVRLKRSGNTSNKSSALFDCEKRIFNVFSTSTSFDTNRGYSAVDVLLELECENDTQVAYEKIMVEYQKHNS
jgi:hypothetical protein